jgi:Methyltransferase domain
MILQFILEHPGFKSKEASIEYYFRDGENSANKFKELVERCGFKTDQGHNLLEFASGYGCVSRHLQKVMPRSLITACDIHDEAIEFLQNKLGIHAILSKSNPEDLVFKEKYDLVFALSFFSHIPKNNFALWLRALKQCVKRSGYFVFTTHGLVSKRLHFGSDCQLDSEGFYFAPMSEQKDLSVADYGSTVVAPRFVFSLIEKLEGISLNYFQEGFWWGHQDVYVLKSDS